jgi:hypothetical protein
MMAVMRAQPISPPLLVRHIADRLPAPAGPGPGWTRVALDAPPGSGADALAADLAAELRLRGRAALVVSAWDFLRPASLRLELGREDPDLFYEQWLDTGALVRELFDPLEPGGSGRVLPAFWDAVADRARRADYVDLAPGGVLLLHGAFLLSTWLPFDLRVHLWVSAAALERRTAPRERWTLPAYARYGDEVDPVRTADVVVRYDDPAHPALVDGD